MARARLIKWKDQIINVDAMLARDPEIWPKTVVPLTRCLLAFMEAFHAFDPDGHCSTPYTFDPAVAVHGLSDDLERIAAILYPEFSRRRREIEESAAEWRREHQERAKQKISDKLRTAVFERDEYRCRQCGTHLQLCADHIIPECQGGPTTLDNLQTLCRPCNAHKAGKMPE
jgi:hypothetical protein